MSDLDERVDVSDGGGDDLFGDGGSDDGSQIAENEPILSDDDMASDHGRERSEAPEAVDADDDGTARELRRVMEMPVARHGLPKHKDGNVSCALPRPSQGPLSRIQANLPTDANGEGAQLSASHPGGVQVG